MDYREITGKTSLGDIGRCIYCEATDDLSDEHVVPFALGGHLYVGKASCSRCRDLTSKFETHVLRGFMLKGRIVGDFPTRRPRDRPENINVRFLEGGTSKDVTLPWGNAPALLMLPTFERASSLGGSGAAQGVSICGLEAIHFGADIDESVRRQAASGFSQADTIAATAFAKMLAKIGYSFAVGMNGMFPLEQSPILSFIMGESDDPGRWIGSAQFETQSEKRGASHALQLVESDVTGGSFSHVVIARIKLFASSGSTGYEVVVRAY